MKCKVVPSRMCCDFFRLNEQLAALNPDTPPESVREALDDLDGVLVMTVDPGYARQKMTAFS